MYQIAGIVGVLRTILIILLIYYALRFISRILLPIAFKSFFNRAQNNNQRQDRSSSKREKKSAKKNSDLGEYVDFEEIKDKNEK